MKNLYVKSLILLIILVGISGSKSYATHIPGANITYTCDPANPLTYTFTFTVFVKCPDTHPATMASFFFGYTCLMRSYNSTNFISGCAYTGLTFDNYTYLPNIRFTSCNPPSAPTYTWTPNTNLSNTNIANPIATPTADITYVVKATGGICDAFDTVNIIMCPVLPIEMLSFDAICKEDRVILNWATATEINNSYFTIERSIDAINFIPIGTVNGNGNSSTTINYSWTDNEPFDVTSYYRLKQVDFNGAFEYHGINAITCKQSGNISIYPNPFENSFTVQLSENSTYPLTIEVLDYLGRTVYSKTIETNLTVIAIDELSTGTYFVKVFNKTTQVVERIVKMK